MMIVSKDFKLKLLTIYLLPFRRLKMNNFVSALKDYFSVYLVLIINFFNC